RCSRRDGAGLADLLWRFLHTRAGGGGGDFAAAMTDWPAGFACAVFDSIDSTNEEARRRSAAGETGPVWIAARRQSAGRGRLGRSWVTEPGNLAATLLLPFRG